VGHGRHHRRRGRRRGRGFASSGRTTCFGDGAGGFSCLGSTHGLGAPAFATAASNAAILDADADGIPDANDNCPSKGLGKNRWADVDGDGVMDAWTGLYSEDGGPVGSCKACKPFPLSTVFLQSPERPPGSLFSIYRDLYYS
jgi:hypothetical protein